MNCDNCKALINGINQLPCGTAEYVFCNPSCSIEHTQTRIKEEPKDSVSETAEKVDKFSIGNSDGESSSVAEKAEETVTPEVTLKRSAKKK